MKQLAYSSIGDQFRTIKKYTNIKKSLSIHCFRKTRATMMFSARTKDGGIIYDDKEMGQYFGWKSHTVIKRRLQYDLRNYDDFKDKIFGNLTKPLETYDTLKQEKDMLENEYKKKIADMEEQMHSMKETIRSSVLAEIKDIVNGYTK